ncbi:MMPL family transporter [Streptomyces mirabilis]
MAVLRTIANITDVSVFSMSLVTILGLAVAIDYGLLIVSRYREELAAGYTGEAAIGRTLATAGRTVMVSGTTVAAALAGLTLFPSTFLKSMSYGGVAAVLLAVLFSLVALPALLAVMGPKVNAFPLRRRKKAGRPTAAGEGSWYRFGHGLMRRRWVVVVGAVGLLLTLALPFSKIEFGSVNAQQLPSTSEGRQVFNAMEHDFDGDAVKSIDSLLVLKSDGTSKDQGAALKAYAERLGATKDATSARITGAHPAGNGRHETAGQGGLVGSGSARPLLRPVRHQGDRRAGGHRRAGPRRHGLNPPERPKCLHPGHFGPRCRRERGVSACTAGDSLLRMLAPPACTVIMATVVRVFLGQSPQQPDDRFEQHGEDHRSFGEGDAVFESVELREIQVRGGCGEPCVGDEVVGRVVGAEAAQRGETFGECRAVR